MKKLLIDLGNTRMHWALSLNAGDVGAVHHSSYGDKDVLLEKINTVEEVLWASVAGNQHELWLRDNLPDGAKHIQVKQHFQGLTVGYHEPLSLGVDRWLGMLGVWVALQSSFILVSMGTATTIDVVDDKGKHLGGYILPGHQLWMAALNQCAKINIKAENPSNDTSFGLNTLDAVQNGYSLWLKKGLSALIIELKERHQAKVVLTGGELRQLTCADWTLENAVLLGLSYCDMD